jgi:hypothetical protein
MEGNEKRKGMNSKAIEIYAMLTKVIVQIIWAWL